MSQKPEQPNWRIARIGVVERTQDYLLWLTQTEAGSEISITRAAETIAKMYAEEYGRELKMLHTFVQALNDNQDIVIVVRE